MTTRLKEERGAVSALFAILLVLLLIPIGAIVVDIGFWYTNAKKAQNAADAGALAAASQIPSDGAATSAGGQYVTYNMRDVTTNIPDATTAGCPTVPNLSYCVEYPYKPDSGPNTGAPQVDEVEVVVRHPAPTFFGRIFGMFGVSSTRRAVAEKFEIPGNLAIFSYNYLGPCDSSAGLRFNGANMSINGLVHSNSAFEIIGQNFWAADGTIQRNNCVAAIDSPPTSQFGQDPSATRPRDLNPPPGHQPWPVWHTPDDFGWYSSVPVPFPNPPPTNGCRFRAETITINDTDVITSIPDSTTAHDGTIPTGIYCAIGSNGKFEISGNNLQGTFTAVAREITVSGNGHNFTHFAQRTLLFAVPNSDTVTTNDGAHPDGAGITCDNDKELILNLQDSRWSGTIFSPCNRVKINGDDSPSLEGTIVGYRVEVNGAGFRMVGRSEVPAVIELNLVE